MTDNFPIKIQQINSGNCLNDEDFLKIPYLIIQEDSDENINKIFN